MSNNRKQKQVIPTLNPIDLVKVKFKKGKEIQGKEEEKKTGRRKEITLIAIVID
jgi:hypothetical protein